MNMWARLEDAWWVTPITHSPVAFALTSMLHYFSFFVLVGTIALVDLRVLGIAVRRKSVRSLAEQLYPWTWTALIVAIVTGFFEFAGGADEFVASKMFLLKLAAMVVGIIFAALVQVNVSKWDTEPVMPGSAKVTALLSLVIWLGVILSALEVANYNAV
jgi:uncharacterized membrane protein